MPRMNDEKLNCQPLQEGRTLNPVDVHVGSRLRLRRVMAGLSQTALSLQVGMSFQQIQNYESGTNRIAASTLWDFSVVLGVSVGFFFEDMPDSYLDRNSSDITPTRAAITPRRLLDTQETHELIASYCSLPSDKLRETVMTFAKEFAKRPSRHAGNINRGHQDEDL